MRRLSPRAHGLLEYLVVPIWLAAPDALGLAGPARPLAWGIGAAILTIALLTDYPVGVFRVIPFPVHGWIDRIGTPLVTAAPWIGGFANQTSGLWLFSAMGAFAMLVTWSTDFRRGHDEPRRPRNVRHA